MTTECWGAHKNLNKGGDSTDNRGGCCQAGGKEDLEGGKRREKDTPWP